MTIARPDNACNHPLDIADGAAEYCPHCGQALPVSRIDWVYLKDAVRNDVLSLEHGLPHTLLSLFSRPGHLIRDFLEGRRAGIVKPFPLLVMTAGVALLFAEWFLKGDIIGPEMQQGAMSGALSAKQGNAALHSQLFAEINRVGAWFNGHFTLVTFLVLPVEAACMRLAFKRFKQLNYPEWLVITSYLTVQTFVIWCVLIPLMVKWPGLKDALMPASIIIGTLTFMQFFQGYPKWKTALRGLWAFALSQLVIFALMVVAGFILAAKIATTG